MKVAGVLLIVLGIVVVSDHPTDWHGALGTVGWVFGLMLLVRDEPPPKWRAWRRRQREKTDPEDSGAKRAAARAICAAEGHVGMVIPWGLHGDRPSNEYIFKHARCSRCGELRWPDPDTQSDTQGAEA